VPAAIVALTASADPEKQLEAERAGVDAYMTKPFSHADLVARIRGLLRRPSTPEPDLTTLGELTVDLSSGRCWRGSAEVELTARESSVLRCLASQRGQVISKRSILANVWGADAASSRIVDDYVGYLRTKLGSDAGDHLIESVDDVGYRFGPGCNCR
jgi:DNA-binding response OmpR family regulator